MAYAHVATFGIGTGSSNREDLMDMISIIDPWETPLFLASPKRTVNHVTVEWLTDTLAATSTGGGTEGQDFQMGELSGRTRSQNVTQIFRKDIWVSNTQRAVNPAGVRDEYEYQIEKALKEIARNIECRALAASGASAAGGTATVRLMKSIEAQISTNVDTANTTALGLDTATPGGLSASATLMTEDRFNAMLELIFNSGGNPDSAYVSAAVKRQISAFSGQGASRRNIAMADKKLIASIDMYDSDVGLIQIVLDRWVPQAANTGTNHTGFQGTAHFIETGMINFGILRPIRHVPLAAAGDATRGMVVGELTCMVLNEKSCGRYWGVSNYKGAQG